MNFDPGIRFGYADVGEVKLHYALAGTGERLVILLHGFPEFWYSWRHQLVALSEGLTVVAPDLRGYGLSDRPSDAASYKIEKLVGDVLGLIKHFGRKEAAVIGHDWGAAIAWATALSHPQSVWKLGALQVPSPGLWKRNITVKQLLASWYMFFFQLPVLPEWVASRNDFAKLESSMRATAAIPVFGDEEITAYRANWRQQGSLTGPINYYRANLVGSLCKSGTSADKRVSMPTFFIYGEKDHAVLPATVRNVASCVDAPFRELRIPGAGHWVQQEARDEVTAALRNFLTE